MATELEQCEQHAKKLPLHERAILIQRLIADLDDLDEQNLERLWVQEAARRCNEFDSGNIKARPSAEVFRDARTKGICSQKKTINSLYYQDTSKLKLL